MMQTLYADDDLHVIALLQDSDAVLVTFTPFKDVTTDNAVFGETLVRSQRFSGIFISAADNHWWQCEGRDAMCDAVRMAAAPFSRRIAYGASMGAYGALCFGARMGCDRIVAVAPQTVISDPDVPLSARWRELIARRPIVRDDVVADLGGIVPEFLYDPYQPNDSAHVGHIASRAPVRELHFPFAGHKLLKTLQQCGILSATMTAVLTDGIDAPGLQSAYLETRERSTLYAFEYGRRLAAKGDLAGALQCADRLRTAGDDGLLRRLTDILDAAGATQAR